MAENATIRIELTGAGGVGAPGAGKTTDGPKSSPAAGEPSIPIADKVQAPSPGPGGKREGAGRPAGGGMAGLPGGNLTRSLTRMFGGSATAAGGTAATGGTAAASGATAAGGAAAAGGGAAAAGSAAIPVIGAIVAGIAAIGAGIKKMVQNANEVADRLTPYSAEAAGARGMEYAKTVSANVSAAQQHSASLAEWERVKGGYGRAWNEAKNIGMVFAAGYTPTDPLDFLSPTLKPVRQAMGVETWPAVKGVVDVVDDALPFLKIKEAYERIEGTNASIDIFMWYNDPVNTPPDPPEYIFSSAIGWRERGNQAPPVPKVEVTKPDDSVDILPKTSLAPGGGLKGSRF